MSSSDDAPSVTTEPSRAKMLMLLAADYIRQHAPDHTVHYDEADCDGYCLADDLRTEAAQLS